MDLLIEILIELKNLLPELNNLESKLMEAVDQKNFTALQKIKAIIKDDSLSGSLNLRDRLNLHLGAPGQGADLEAAAGRAGRVEKLAIDLVHRGKIAHIGKEYLAFYHLFHAAARRLKDRRHIFQRPGGLFGHALRQIAVRVLAQLAADE